MDTTGPVRTTMKKFSEMVDFTHPFRLEVYRRIDGELNFLAGEAMERVYAGDQSYREIADDAVAVQIALSRLWATIQRHERREMGQD